MKDKIETSLSRHSQDGSRRNPNWSFEETVLALDLYLQKRPVLPPETDPSVIELSNFLRNRAMVLGISGSDNFRNPTGVSMKLSNISRFDTKLMPGRAGLPNGSAIEEAVWLGYAGDQARLREAVDNIRAEIPLKAPSGAVSEANGTLPHAIHVTGMWGYTPDIHGYVGFSQEWPRKKYLSHARAGDLMVIIGQNGETADARDVGRMLGLVELDPRPVEEAECMSAEAYREKVAQWGTDRWRYAMPVIRAWKFTNEVKAAAIMPISCAAANGRVIGSSFRTLTFEEVEAVLRLPCRPWKVWGQPEWNDVVDRSEMRAQRVDLAIKRGPRPTYGTQTHYRQDGETYLYIMALHGPAAGLFKSKPLEGKVVIKFGISNDVARREAELNCGFPSLCELEWKLKFRQMFASGDDAYEAETRMLDLLKSRGHSIGGEFAIVPEREVGSLLGAVSHKSAFVIAGPNTNRHRRN